MTDIPTTETHSHVMATAQIVAAYLNQGHDVLLVNLIADVRKALVADISKPAEPEAPKKDPAVSIRASVKPDSVTCLHCGRVMKSLKRHIGSVHGQTPEAYREFWKLPEDHPIVAPNYSATRSNLAKVSGLGRKH